MLAPASIATNVLRAATAGSSHSVPFRGFSVSRSPRMGLKESSTETDVDYDRHKQDSLSKQKKGSGHWKPELASDSEEAVRADRVEGGMTPDAVSRLQEKTKRAAEETSKAGTSMRDGM